MKTLVVHYLPSGEKSNTKKLLDIFLAELGGREVEELNLLTHPAPTFNEKNIQAYAKRNYAGQTLSAAESLLLQHNDDLVTQLKNADILVMAYPMHNFGMPGPVKCYLDAVIIKGQTFEYGPAGNTPMMKAHKALTLFTAGGIYPSDKVNQEYPNWDMLTLGTKINFGFMGYAETEVIGTSLRDPSQAEAKLHEAKGKIQAIIKKWYTS